MKNLLKNIKFIKLKKVSEKNGELIAVEFSKKHNLNAKRMFQVYAGSNNIRGKHAHKKSSQLLICSHGEIEIKSTDGFNSRVFILNKPNIALLIPPMIWSELKYKNKLSILTVITDTFYSSKDYIKDYKKYLEVNKKKFKKK